MNVIDKIRIKSSGVEANVKDSISDYTAFEVMPNKVEIAAGTVDEVTGLSYVTSVAACTTHKMTLRSHHEPEDCDVVIDWGDGTTDSIKDGDFVSHTEGSAYELSHDYSANMTADIQRFVVKIFGKNYYTFRHNLYKTNNLISQAMSSGFPVASHIGNFASIVTGANRLLKVAIPHSASPYSNVFNWSYAFAFCSNLLELTGFSSISIADNACLDNMLEKAQALTTTDFRIPGGCSKLKGIFYDCRSLEADINDLLPKDGFSASHIGIYPINLFYNNQKLTGTVPADKLWDSPIIWTFGSSDGKETPFTGCSEDIRSQVPVSWGGTNTAIEQRLVFDKFVKENNISLTDYTAFEVCAHDYDIVAGTPISETLLAPCVPPSFYESTTLPQTIQETIPANMTHMMTLRTMQPDYSKSDVIIDWGDGTYSSVSNQDFETGVWADTGHSEADNERNYTFRHTYKENGLYIVKVYGRQYYNIRHISLCTGEGTLAIPTYTTSSGKTYTERAQYWRSNLMCRCFDTDLPLASNLRHLAHFCSYASLIMVNANIIKYFHFQSIDNCFYSCKNLVKAVEFKRYFTKSNCQSAFYYCGNLVESDLQLPIDSVVNAAGKAIYAYCYKLAVDIATLIPDVDRATRLNVSNFLQNNESVYGTVDPKRLWNNPHIVWTATAGAFQGCPAAVRAQVPVSWGGTNTAIEQQLVFDKFVKENNISLTDYTAFEVYASDTLMSTTTAVSDIPEDFIPVIFKKQKSELTEEELSSTPIKNDIVANKKHVMNICTTGSYGDNDVVISWGDGSYLYLSDALDSDNNIVNTEVMSVSLNSDGIATYKVGHEYAEAGIYKITIYGKCYWRIDHGGCADYNLLCRALTPELPIASNFTNLSSYCHTCRRLFDIDLAYYTASLRNNIDNFSGTFANCFNLKKVDWFAYTNYVVQGVPKIFHNCQNAITINYKLPTHFADGEQGIKSAFGWCKNLTMDINDLFHSEKFENKNIAVGELFRRCAKLYGTVPADKLWNDRSITWTETENAFEGCSSEIRAQVPVSWGGTADDSIIAPEENTAVMITAGSAAEAQEVILSSGILYVVCSPATLVLPGEPKTGAIIDIVIAGSDSAVVTTGTSASVGGSTSVDLATLGVSTDNSQYKLIYNEATNNWLIVK